MFTSDARFVGTDSKVVVAIPGPERPKKYYKWYVKDAREYNSPENL